MTSSPIVLMTVPWFCSVAVRISSMQSRHDLAGALVAHHFVDAGGPDDVGEHDGEFDVRAHVTYSEKPFTTLRDGP